MTLLLRNVTIGASTNLDAVIENGRISTIRPTGVTPTGSRIVDCGGALLLPSFVDPHVHLDKTRFGGPRLSHRATSTVAQRAANERALRKILAHDPFTFGLNLARELVRQGTTHIRSHVDIDPDIGLTHAEACLRIKEAMRGMLDIQLVAFPQSGICTSPGVAELMDEALSMGLDLVGGLDPQTVDGDLHGHLDAVFDLAARHQKGADLHIHEPGQAGLATIREIARRTAAMGLEGKVTISHGYAIGQVDARERAAIIAELAAARISVATSAPGATVFPPVEELLDAGLVYAGMSDNIQDMWSPWGNGDQLERAWMLAYRNNFRADALIERCFGMVTTQAGNILGLEGHGVPCRGMTANLTAVMAEDIPSAVLARPPRLFTVKNGEFTYVNPDFSGPVDPSAIA